MRRKGKGYGGKSCKQPRMHGYVYIVHVLGRYNAWVTCIGKFMLHACRNAYVWQ